MAEVLLVVALPLLPRVLVRCIVIDLYLQVMAGHFPFYKQNLLYRLGSFSSQHEGPPRLACC